MIGYFARLEDILSSRRFGFLLGGIAGAIVFLLIWGADCLNPTNVDWAVRPFGSDFGFMAIGSMAYLREPWTFPLGNVESLLFPGQTSIVYLDAIPLMAIPAKVLAPFFEGSYQYFGIWGLVCFFLQGALSVVIFRKHVTSNLVAMLASFIVILSPFILGKMFGHASMSGQWVLLFAIVLVWYRDSPRIIRGEIWLWTTACGLSISVLPYFTPMVGALMVLYFWLRMLSGGWMVLRQRAVPAFILSGLAVLLVFWMAGGFLPGLQKSSNDYGMDPFNLNGFFNPIWASRLLKGLPFGSASGESYAWLGLGVMSALIAVVFDATIRGSWRTIRPSVTLAFVTVSGGLILFAATNKIMWGDHVLVDIVLPERLLAVLSIFRTSGRFIWPVWYLLVFSIVGRFSALGGNSFRQAIAVGAIVFVQLFDGAEYVKRLNRLAPSAMLSGKNDGPLVSDFWATMGQHWAHLYFVPFSGRISHAAWAQMTYYATKQGMTTNTFWLGRYPFSVIQDTIVGKMNDLDKGILGRDELIVLNSLNIAATGNFSGELGLYTLDGQWVVSRRQLAAQAGASVLHAVSVRQVTLAEALRYVGSLGNEKLVVITARDSNKISLDQPTRDALRDLGIGAALGNGSPYNYVAVFHPASREVIYEANAATALQFHAAAERVVGGVVIGQVIEVNVDGNYGRFPLVRVGGFDCSQSYVGLNICVVDMNAKVVEEVGVFDLYWMTKGILVKY